MATAVRSGYVVNQGNPLNYFEWGDRDAPCLVFLNTIRGTAYFWRPIVERLDDRYRCIGLDLRGHGNSGPVLSPHLDVDLWVSDVEALVTQLELPPVTLIVWAQIMAGVGVRFAAHHPKHVRSLVVSDGGLGLRPNQIPEARQRMSVLPTEFATWDEAVAFERGRGAASIKPLIEERAPYTFRRLTNGKVIWKYDPLAREDFAGAEPPPYIGANPPEVWEKIRCPILFVATEGGSAALSLDECKQLSAKYGKGSRWVEVPNTKHWIHEENLDGFLAAITPFLEETSRAK